MATAIEEISEGLLAQERKKIHESSKHIYPRCEKSTGTTSYSIDYAKKEGKPASPRPCSGTRRNRPHPSQGFLDWRIPSKPLTRQITCTNDTNETFLNLSDVETSQRFYDDYVGRPNAVVDKCKLCRQDISPLVPRYPTRPRVLQRAEFDRKSKKELGSTQFSLQNRNVVVGFKSNLSKNTIFNNDLELEKERFRLMPSCLDKNASAVVSKAGRDAISDQFRQMFSKEVRGAERRGSTKCPPLKKGKNLTHFPPRGFMTYNYKGALFMQPRRCQPRHFEIHPEFRDISAK